MVRVVLPWDEGCATQVRDVFPGSEMCYMGESCVTGVKDALPG